jgi:hypothetical protein
MYGHMWMHGSASEGRLLAVDLSLPADPHVGGLPRQPAVSSAAVTHFKIPRGECSVERAIFASGYV